MRTTIDIAPDVMDAAKVLVRVRRQSLGVVISELARRGLQSVPPPKTGEHKGIPILVHGENPVPVTSELVERLLDAD
ncbi:MAG: hypothetical protein R2762_28310 [Bryobacteraceae bacterium]